MNYGRKFATQFAAILLGLFLFPSCRSQDNNGVSAEILRSRDLGLLEAAISLQKEVGNSVWPGFSDYRTAVIYITERGQVLLNPSIPFDGYKPYKGIIPSWAHQGLFSDKHLTPDGTILSDKEFNTNYFASAYSPLTTNGAIQKPVFFVDSLDRFHAKKWNWSVEDWLSIFWHEVFHNFQDSQIPSGVVSRDALDFSNIQALLEDPEYLEMVESELSLISRVLHETSPSRKRQYICKDLLSSRRKRANSLLARGRGKAALKAERFYETSEGTARYIEEMMSLQSAHLPVNALEATTQRLEGDKDYQNFKKFRQRTLETYYDRIAKLSSGDRYYYQTGFAVALLLDQIQPSWKQKVFRNVDLDTLVEPFCRTEK